MNRELLEQPFDKTDIKRRKGRGGGIWDYIEVSGIIRRLNDAFDGNWSFEIVSFEQIGEELLVLGKLTAEGITKMQFGGKQISHAKDGSIVCITDDYKAATSDSLKKAATLFGIALDLYLDEDKDHSGDMRDLLMVRINKGEKFLAERDDVDEPAIRKQYWEFADTPFENATDDQLNAYLSLLLNEATGKKADGQDTGSVKD